MLSMYRQVGVVCVCVCVCVCLRGKVGVYLCVGRWVFSRCAGRCVSLCVGRCLCWSMFVSDNTNIETVNHTNNNWTEPQLKTQ